MKFRRFDNFIWITCFFILVTLGWSSTCVAQKSTDTISTVVIDSAPKKLYSELYSDETGNQFMVEIYEEPQEGENLIHFRSFKNGKIIGRKSQALAYAHNFTFFIDETEQRIMRQDTEKMLYNVLKKLMEESDQKLKTNLEDLLDQEKLAQALSEKIKSSDEQIAAMATRISKEIQTPDEQIAAMATRISKEIQTPDEQIAAMATRISKEIQTPDEQIAAMATRISKEIQTPDEQIAAMATRISKEIQTPDEQIAAMATRISKEITFDGGTVKNMAERISEQIKTPDEQIAAMATRISKEITFDGGTVKNMAERISEQIKSSDEQIAAIATRISKEIQTPDEQIAAMATRISKEIQTPDDQISDMATRISRQIKTPEARVNEDSLALTLAIKLTQKENLVAMKIPPYADLLSQVSATNEQQEYEKTIELLDEDIANRTPDEQRKALKISGLMSVLVASKKLKRAISTINDYDLPDDPGLREISAALSEWLSKNLITD
jgi:flagellar capping protein FliD